MHFGGLPVERNPILGYKVVIDCCVNDNTVIPHAIHLPSRMNTESRHIMNEQSSLNICQNLFANVHCVSIHRYCAIVWPVYNT